MIIHCCKAEGGGGYSNNFSIPKTLGILVLM